jgi:uncharacterized protein YbjT (DUF2867 family)
VIAVAGATGALGALICAELRAAGAEVRELARPRVDLTRPETLDLAGVECVVSTATCFPRDPTPGAIGRIDRDGNLALVDAAETAGVRRFVFVSFPPHPLAFPLQDAKRAVERRLVASPLETIVLQPTPFLDIWFSPLLGVDLAARTATIYGSGAAPVSWLARADVARVAVRAATGPGPRGAGEVVPFGGPEALSQREALARLGGDWALETVPAEELERRHAEGDEVVRSLAALMLQCHLGMTAPPHELAPTTVEAWASRLP